jgi:hypothetical protein
MVKKKVLFLVKDKAVASTRAEHIVMETYKIPQTL